MSRSAFLTRFGLDHALIQAPMAGGATTPELVAAVSNAGALGSLAGALLPPGELRQAIQAVRARTRRPFAVNLFVQPVPRPESAQVEQARKWLAPHYAVFDLEPPVPDKWCEDFDDQLEVLIELSPAVASFAFGIVTPGAVARMRAAGIAVIGTATHLEEALAWQSVGADALCVQGMEAGGHRATFIGDFDAGMTGLMALLPQIVDRVSLPVIAAGGVMDGRGIAACHALGASAVQLGTAFLPCPESGIPVAWKQALQQAGSSATRITRVFSGRPARALENGFMRKMAGLEWSVPGYPVQNALTAPLRQLAARSGMPDYMALWAGQGVALSRVMPAATLVERLVRESAEVMQGLARAQ